MFLDTCKVLLMRMCAKLSYCIVLYLFLCYKTHVGSSAELIVRWYLTGSWQVLFCLSTGAVLDFRCRVRCLFLPLKLSVDDARAPFNRDENWASTAAICQYSSNDCKSFAFYNLVGIPPLTINVRCKLIQGGLNQQKHWKIT